MAAAAPLKQPTSMFAMRAQPMCYTNVRDQQECMRSRYVANVLVLERTAELPNASLTCRQREYGHVEGVRRIVPSKHRSRLAVPPSRARNMEVCSTPQTHGRGARRAPTLTRATAVRCLGQPTRI